MSKPESVTTTAATGQPVPITEKDLASLGGPMTDCEYAEKHLKGVTVEELLTRLPTYAQIIGHKWPEETPKEVLQAWVFGATQASEEIKRVIADWRKINVEV